MSAVRLDYFEDGGDGQRAIVASAPGHGPSRVYVGTLRWDAATGIISGVGVEPRYRRKGVATRMWDMAQGCTPPPLHPRCSPVLTADGRAWGNSLNRHGLSLLTA